MSMLVLVAWVHAEVGVAQDLTNDQRTAISAIEQLGAKVTVKNSVGGVSTEVFLSDYLSSDIPKAVSLLPTLPKCRKLVTYWATITDHELAVIGKLDDLQTLNLSDSFTCRNSEISDEGIRYLSNLNQLRVLYLARTRITNDGLRHVRSLGELEEIDISNTAVGSSGMAHLRNLESITALNLDGTRVDDAGLIHIGKLHKLESLSLGGTQVSGTEIPQLNQLENLVDLNLDSTSITDLACVKIAKLKTLTRLSLNDTRVTDDAIGALTELTNLNQLALHWTFVTDDGNKIIKHALPKLEIQTGTRLPDRDVDAIKRLLKSNHEFEGEILGMETLQSGDVSVTTGKVSGPRSGDGVIFTLRKTKKTWKVVGRYFWVS